MKIHNCIFFQLSRVSRAGARHWRKKLLQFGVTSAQAQVLIALSENDQVTSKSLGKKIEFDSATLTGLIDRMENANLVERRSNTDDRRAILICLTDQGKKTTKKIQDIAVEENLSFLSDLTPEEGMILRSLLKKLV